MEPLFYFRARLLFCTCRRPAACAPCRAVASGMAASPQSWAGKLQVCGLSHSYSHEVAFVMSKRIWLSRCEKLSPGLGTLLKDVNPAHHSRRTALVSSAGEAPLLHDVFPNWREPVSLPGYLCSFMLISLLISLVLYQGLMQSWVFSVEHTVCVGF